jgi:hypothetical protein
MTNTEIKIRFPDTGSAADLELRAPFGVDLAELLDRTSANVGFRVGSTYTVHTDRRVITRARVTESDGARLSERRSSEVLSALRFALGSEGGEDARDSGYYPVARLRTRAA